MIGSLKGRVIELYAPFVLLDVGGVGYEVETPMRVFCQLNKDTEVFLWVHLVVREDAQLLYGFLSNAERGVFRTLIKINGVGAKLAIAILSSLDTQDLIAAIEDQDTSRLIKVPGVGKKTAERLMIELRDKFNAIGVDRGVAISSSPSREQEDEARAALISLGYSDKEAQKAIEQIAKPELNVQQLIRLALQQLSG